MEVLHFNVHPSLHHFTDLSQTALELQIRVVHKDGSELTGPELNRSCFCVLIPP
jgi:hypothetical protein